MLVLVSTLVQDRGRRPSLAELAKQSRLSPGHFQRVFTRWMGESPKQYTRRVRLEHAAALLIRNEQSILDIALDCAFDSHEGFIRAFRRHFGISPRILRQRAAGLTRQAAQRQGALIRSIGPCVRLYGIRVDHHHQIEEPLMRYEVQRQPFTGITLLCQERRCTHANLSKVLGECLPASFEYATSQGVAILGQPITRYIEWGPGVVTIQGGVPVPSGTTVDDGELKTVELLAGETAMTIHRGPYDGLAAGHAALETWILDHQLNATGPAFEIYVTDPGEVPDPADWITEIHIPIAA